MPKHGFLTAKAIGNRIKSKGLQKLRWYCQICQKQCRDANGFKCHTMSEPHQRQMLLVAGKQGKVIDEFSVQFRNEFLRLLQRRYNTRRVLINTVYNEYISDKEHLHMNASKWRSLTEFTQYLGREGYCIVDETPKGWYIQWIDRDPETLKRAEKVKRMEAAKRDEEDRAAEMLQAQIERDRQAAAARGDDLDQTPEVTGLQRETEDDKVVLKLGTQAKSQLAPAAGLASKQPVKAAPAKMQTDEDLAAKFGIKPSTLNTAKRRASDKPMSALERIKMENEAAKKAKREREEAQRDVKVEHWLHEGIIVKIVNKKLQDGKYHKRKGVVLKVIDKFIGKIQLLDSKTILKLDQEYLETVIPKVGGPMLILNGRYRGLCCRLERIDVDHFGVLVVLREGKDKGKKVELPYEDVSKLDLA
eukprot:TRINITY_DN9529_c0_g3_i2.p1 TRINITY_DN9529_c0_g3~~TRINITY_DN9529_c0_g3_i2.p1  ORF type:complete len:417 (+),score=108.63 TRINITY_DN9529_c0_g3_i2:242-1492(+)